ncbi:MAG: penicillin-binding protein 1C [Candidatus Kapaibacterium sp.]
MNSVKSILQSTKNYIIEQWKHHLFRVGVYMVAGMIVVFTLLDVLFPVPTTIRYSQIITSSNGTVLYSFLSDDDKWRMKIQPSEISPVLKQAIIAKEDRWFYWHIGINPLAVGRAFINNIRYFKITSGASTITMQVARLLEPKERTYFNKFREVFRALQLELHYSKDEIFQMYCNLIPYGGNIEGVKAASLLYFNKLPLQLTLSQATTLAIIPNRPTTLRIGETNPAIRTQRDVWLHRYQQAGDFPVNQITDALNEPLSLKRIEAPRLAPHFALLMHNKYPTEPIITTTLNVQSQVSVQTLSSNYITRMRMLGIYNCSVIVVNNQTHNVEAYLGSPEFNDKLHAGQVDGVQAVRSPGSALKPMIYAMGIDKGLLTPKMIVSDVPVNYDGYAPENYDQTFKGEVTVEQALAQSLNIPAVTALHIIGVPQLASKLSSCGFKSIKKDAKNVGLSLALGGCGVTLEEMARLYSGFANYGNVQALHWVPTDTSTKAIRVASPAATYMITDILTQLTRPDLPVTYQASARVPKIAWKTGTSYGRHDAWSIGYNTKYTVAVWVGNFSGEGSPDLSGATSATPLLFDIFNSIDNSLNREWFKQPQELDFRIVCSESGLTPGEYCTNTVADYYIPTISPATSCTHMKEVFVSADEKKSYCTSCLPQSGYKKILFRNYAPEILSYYRQEHITVTLPPEHNPDCQRVTQEYAPTITSPTNGKQYIVNRNDKNPLMLSCLTANDVKVVYWFLNDKLISTSPPTEHVFIKPERGENKISCSDDKGRNTDITVTIEWE